MNFSSQTVEAVVDLRSDHCRILAAMLTLFPYRYVSGFQTKVGMVIGEILRHALRAVNLEPLFYKSYIHCTCMMLLIINL